MRRQARDEDVIAAQLRDGLVVREYLPDFERNRRLAEVFEQLDADLDGGEDDDAGGASTTGPEAFDASGGSAHNVAGGGRTRARPSGTTQRVRASNAAEAEVMRHKLAALLREGLQLDL